MTFAERMKQLREGASMTQEGLATASGVPVGSVRNYEQGHRIPAFGAIVKIAAALGTDCRAFADCSDISAEEPEKPKKRPRK